MANFREEFPSFPADSMPVLPAGWEDTSWHNDACPSFTNKAARVAMFVDYPNIEDRELSEGGRFVVYAVDKDGCALCDCATIYEGDSIEAALDTAQRHAAREIDPHAICAKWVRVIGIGFHPDTRGKDYSPALSAEQIAEYDADMRDLFAVAADPYECGMMALADYGLI